MQSLISLMEKTLSQHADPTLRGDESSDPRLPLLFYLLTVVLMAEISRLTIHYCNRRLV